MHAIVQRTYSQRLKEKFYRSGDHPYRLFQREIELYLKPDQVLFDAGCGRSAEVLNQCRGKAGKLIGVDLVDFDPRANSLDIELFKGDLANLKLQDNSVDIAISRSVLEHLRDPLPAYLEIARVLKSDGHFIFLTPNLRDYTAIFSKIIPNNLHPWIVLRTEGRNEEDTFPAYYKSNTFKAVRQLAQKSGFEIVSFKYLGQYPSYFMFNPVLFLMATGYEKLTSKFDSLRFLRGWLLVVLRKSKGR